MLTVDADRIGKKALFINALHHYEMCVAARVGRVHRCQRVANGGSAMKIRKRRWRPAPMTARLGLRIPDDLNAALEAECQRRHQQLADLVRSVLRDVFCPAPPDRAIAPQAQSSAPTA